jgi:hypothetical protein
MDIITGICGLLVGLAIGNFITLRWRANDAIYEYYNGWTSSGYASSKVLLMKPRIWFSARQLDEMERIVLRCER